MARYTAAPTRTLICVLLLQSLLLVEAKPQTSTTNGALSHRLSQPSAVSLPHLYWHFLEYQYHLDQVASQRESEGKDGNWLRSYLQKQLGFTDVDFAPIRASADALHTTISALNTKAMAVAASDRNARAKGLVPAGTAPPGLPELKALTAERETAIADEISHLNGALTLANQTTLRNFLVNKFSLNVTIVKIDSNKHPQHPINGIIKHAKVQQ